MSLSAPIPFLNCHFVTLSRWQLKQNGFFNENSSR